MFRRVFFRDRKYANFFDLFLDAGRLLRGGFALVRWFESQRSEREYCVPMGGSSHRDDEEQATAGEGGLKESSGKGGAGDRRDPSLRSG
ncbi:hypothetical protein [Tunturiibacter gelidoferens]|uniref:Uncharacterized protein n=1 Tax=Tunturiibacter gelidiferens TaxID=3069689 RepID=A0ACC5NTR7_9BACT|nr:hypothetical protein [Edaphobacter lichenicola]MBB5337973.1 hypothetical protein [Edaphobacter lichenicola]